MQRALVSLRVCACVFWSRSFPCQWRSPAIAKGGLLFLVFLVKPDSHRAVGRRQRRLTRRHLDPHITHAGAIRRSMPTSSTQQNGLAHRLHHLIRHTGRNNAASRRSAIIWMKWDVAQLIRPPLFRWAQCNRPVSTIVQGARVSRPAQPASTSFVRGRGWRTTVGISIKA